MTRIRPDVKDITYYTIPLISRFKPFFLLLFTPPELVYCTEVKITDNPIFTYLEKYHESILQ